MKIAEHGYGEPRNFHVQRCPATCHGLPEHGRDDGLRRYDATYTYSGNGLKRTELVGGTPIPGFFGALKCYGRIVERQLPCDSRHALDFWRKCSRLPLGCTFFRLP